jgi:class 3 adenylate cyclase
VGEVDRLGGDGPVTLLFTDVEGSTDLRSRLGDALAQEELRGHDEIVRAAVAEHGGHEVKALGDGFMVAFSSPRRALSCAQTIQRNLAARAKTAGERAVRVRIGVHTGEVVEEGGDLFGQAVHAAARITAKAKGGEILVSHVTRTIVGASPELAFSDRGRFRLKGFEERWRLFELAWPVSVEDGAAAVGGAPLLVAAGERTPFVGRSLERATLSAALSRVLDGTGSLVLIGGPPGIGKTRLAEEIASEAAGRSVSVLAGHSYEMAGASPYVALVEILEAALAASEGPETFRAEVLGDAAPEVARLVPRLRRLFPDLPAPLELPPEQERQYLFTCLSDVFGRLASSCPTLVLLDDLQWADEPTLLFLDHFASQLSRLPLMVIGTFRDGRPRRPGRCR